MASSIEARAFDFAVDCALIAAVADDVKAGEFAVALQSADDAVRRRAIRYRARNYAETTSDAQAFCDKVAAAAGEAWSYVRP